MNYTVESIKEGFEEYINKYDGGTMDKRFQGAVIGTLEKACGGKPENRHRVLRMLTGHTSSKELNEAQWYALGQLTLPFKPDGGKWTSGNQHLEEVCNALLNADVDQPGQAKMFEYPELENLNEDNPF